MRLNIFKVPKHQRYNYIPRHWDPDKEDLQERVDSASGVASTDPEKMKSRIVGGMRRRGGHHGSVQKEAVRRANIRLLGIIGILILLTYFFLIRNLPAITSAVEQ